MDALAKKIAELAKALGRKPPVEKHPIDYKTLRKVYEQQANHDVQLQQQLVKQKRIQALHGRSDLNPHWTFDTLIEDSQDVVEAVSVARSFIAAHDDKDWRESGSHMMIFYGDYGRGKSHIAGAIAHALIDQFEITVLYRQLSTLLEMKLFSYDFSAVDNAGQRYREIQHELLEVDLLILDEVCVNETVLKKNAQSWFGNLLRKRLVNKKNCILITNHTLDDLEQALGRYCYESIKEYDTYLVRFRGPSRRRSITTEDNDVVDHKSYQPNQMI